MYQLVSVAWLILAYEYGAACLILGSLDKPGKMCAASTEADPRSAISIADRMD
jgi:hypothetical protein